jgi:hypothetical protein
MHSILSRSLNTTIHLGDLFGVGASLTHSCFSLCVACISLVNITFEASTFFLLMSFFEFECILQQQCPPWQHHFNMVAYGLQLLVQLSCFVS